MNNIGFGEKVKGFLLNPKETFEMVKEEEMGVGVKYFGIWLLIYSILTAIIITTVSGIFASMIPGIGKIMGFGAGIFAAVSSFIILLIIGFIILFIGAAIVHLGVLLVGGKKGYHQTLKAMAYGATPSLALGWIPAIGTIFSLWSLYLEIVGVAKLQEVSTGRAIVAVILPALIIAAVVVVITVFAYTSMMNAGLP